MGIRKDVDWEYLGALLAQGGDDEQVLFFKAFVKECNSWGTQHQVDIQLAGVNQLLSKEEKKTLSMIGYVPEE
jgi:hypothetical protein